MFLYIKPPDESTLGEMLPDDDVWTEGLGGPKTRYLDACEKLVRCTDNLYILQKDLVEKLLDNDDIDDAGPSSRKIFVTNLRKYVVENSIEHRVIVQMCLKTFVIHPHTITNWQYIIPHNNSNEKIFLNFI